MSPMRLMRDCVRPSSHGTTTIAVDECSRGLDHHTGEIFSLKGYALSGLAISSHVDFLPELLEMPSISRHIHHISGCFQRTREAIPKGSTFSGCSVFELDQLQDLLKQTHRQALLERKKLTSLFRLVDHLQKAGL